MKNVYLFEINDVIANQIKLPYSTGLIWSHCIEDSNITENYNLDGWFYYRQDLEEVVEQIKDPTIIGFNCFVWNWNFNLKMSQMIKERYPEAIIVYGGWQQPVASRSQGFFEEHPYVDILVHGEGEITFKELLLENLKENPDFNSVAGCSVKQPDLSTLVTPERPRIQDINAMPSPYLNGLFDEMIKACPFVLETTIETTRGCPYQCTFCEIGTKYYQKIKTQSVEKVKKELDWISKNKAEFIYNADSNFGLIQPDHLELTKYMVKLKKETGYPVAHRCDWAKNKADKVIELSRLFTESGMDKGLTVAVQSMNPATLKAVRRKNVDNGKLGQFLDMYYKEELPAYVELILGLPEETFESFTSGICQVMELGQHNYIGIYSLTAFPNTPFGDPEYIKEYELEIIETYTAFNHYDISEHNEFEREKMVVSTRTLTHEEYKKCHYFRWVVMFGHYLGTVQFISRFLRNHKDIQFKTFYEGLLQYAYDNPDTLIGQELQNTIDSLEATLATEHPWGRILPDVRKNFAWDFEEATAITIAKNKAQFYDEIRDYLINHLKVELEEAVLADLFKYQIDAVLDPVKSYPSEHSYHYNVHEVIKFNDELKPKDHSITFEGNNYEGDYYTWGKEKLWWGRRIGACKLKAKPTGPSKILHIEEKEYHTGTLRD